MFQTLYHFNLDKTRNATSSLKNTLGQKQITFLVHTLFIATVSFASFVGKLGPFSFFVIAFTERIRFFK